MYKGYYHVAEVAETYMRYVGVQQFKDLKIKMMYNCLPVDKVFDIKPEETPV
jgi:hypothetical protein